LFTYDCYEALFYMTLHVFCHISANGIFGMHLRLVQLSDLLSVASLVGWYRRSNGWRLFVLTLRVSTGSHRLLDQDLYKLSWQTVSSVSSPSLDQQSVSDSSCLCVALDMLLLLCVCMYVYWSKCVHSGHCDSKFTWFIGWMQTCAKWLPTPNRLGLWLST